MATRRRHASVRSARRRRASIIRISRQVVVFDASDVEAESRFWAAVVGGGVTVHDGWHSVMVDGEPVIDVQLAPQHEPPSWPSGNPQQAHLDLWVDDIEAAHREVMELGAQLLQASEETDDPDAFQVYADPAGHPFCLCWIKGPAGNG